MGSVTPAYAHTLLLPALPTLLTPCSKASTEERNAKARLLGARDHYLHELEKEAAARLSEISADAGAYTQLLKGLVKQGMVMLAVDEAVNILCRPQDVDKIKSVAAAAAAEYTALRKEEGVVVNVPVTVTADATLTSTAGGVIVTTHNGRIRCNNMLAERLKLAMAGLQPVVRDLLFPSARAEVRTKPGLTGFALHAAEETKRKAAAVAAGVSNIPGRAAAPAAHATFPGHAASSAAVAPAPAASAAAFGSFGGVASAAVDPFAMPAPAPAPAAGVFGGSAAPAGAAVSADPFGDFNFGAPAPAAADPFKF